MIIGTQRMTESLRDLRLFVAAYEERSFTAAAVRENATQSGVSQHIRKLEERFGIQLFTRGTSPIAPTPAGDAYYRSCISILRSYEASKHAMTKFGSGLSGEVVVGLMPTMTRCVLAPALARFVSSNPNAIVRIVEGYSALLTAQVRDGELAFAIVPAFQGAAGLKTRLFQRTPEVLVSRLQSKMKHLAPVELAKLSPLRLVVPSPGNTRRRTIDAYLASNNVRIERVLELDAMLGTLDLVARTNWVTILPGVMMASDISRRSLTVNMIVKPSLTLDLVLIEPLRRAMTPVAEAFLGVLEEETARLNDRWTKYLPRS